MAMVEGIEKLGQLERVLGKVRRLSGRDRLINDVGSLGRGQPQFPYFVRRLTGQVFRQICSRRTGGRVPVEFLGIETALAEDVGCTHHGVLRVRTVSPSKLNASLKSNAITDDLVNFSMK